MLGIVGDALDQDSTLSYLFDLLTEALTATKTSLFSKELLSS